MGFVQPVVWTDQAMLWYGALVGFFVANAIMELTGITQIRYSKFRRGNGISTQLGTLIFDGTPMLFAIGYAMTLAATATPIQWIMSILFVLHFGKRCFEALFVHKYSGPIDVVSVVQITGFYSLAVWLGLFTTARITAAPDLITWIGLATFAAGTVINGYHHLLLANLRARGSTEYVIPRGGLFAVIVCPHYLGELLAWLGIALVSRQLAMYIWFFGETAYLLIRSRNTLKWYRAKFPQMAGNVRGLLPGLV
jgi:3-oxo-5-alpha-steroid 4-dehydrogenase 1